jgi:hypothetical protein
MTDILLLGLGCLFLYWSVKWPWQWYHSAQARVFVDYEDEFSALVEQSEEELERSQDDLDTAEEKQTDQVTDSSRAPEVQPLPKRQARAAGNLRQHELKALSACFLSPMVVAYLLHAIRPYLSRPSGGLVSNSNLTLFILAAEVRPILHLFKLIEARTLYLQKVITEAQPLLDLPQSSQMEQLLQRISSLESQPKPTTTDTTTGSVESTRDTETVQPPSPSKQSFQDLEATTATIKQSLQPQLDALNRAVRRYEKRSTMQSVLLEARLRDLDARVNDALALAAAASRNANRPGLVAYVVEGVYAVVAKVIAGMYALWLVPWQIGYQVYVFLLGPRRPKKKKTVKENVESGSGVRGKKAKVNGRS